MPSTDSDGTDADAAASDGGPAPLTERAVYDAVHHAVRDALWDVLGTLVLTGFLLLLVGTGLSVLQGVVQSPETTTMPAAVLGTAVLSLGALGLLRLYDYL